MGKPWLKLWTDTLSDRKLRRLNPAEKWCWIGLLMLAAETDDNGRIELADGVPMLGEDFRDALDVDDDTWESAYAYFLRMGMIAVDAAGFVTIVNYTKRQEPKDPTGAERQQRHRDKARAAQSVTRDTSVTDDCYVTRDVTPMLRVEVEVEVEAEAEAEGGSRHANALPPPPAPNERIVIDMTNVPPSLLRLYMDASGETGNPPPTFRKWFSEVTSRYTRPQCEAVFRQLSADIVAGKTNGSKWTHTVALFEALNASAKPEKSNGRSPTAKHPAYDPGTAEELAEARRVMDEQRARLKAEAAG